MRSSHQNCERCHIRRTHRRAKYGMCPPCRREYRAELEAQRLSTRARARDPIASAVQDVVLDLDNKPFEQVLAGWHRLNMDIAGDGLMPKIRPEIHKIDPTTINRGRAPKRTFTDEDKQQIGLLYEAGGTYESISKETGANNATISRIIGELGLPRRGGGRTARGMPPEYYRQPGDIPEDRDPPEHSPVIEARIEPIVPEIPEPQRKAIERMILAPKPEPVLHSTRLPASPVTWEVRVAGTISVHVESIEAALAVVRTQYPDLRITGIVQAQ